MLMEGGRKALYHKKHPICVCVCGFWLHHKARKISVPRPGIVTSFPSA